MWDSDLLCNEVAEDLYLANDLVHWSNAVADQLVYNENLYNAVVGVVDVSEASIEIISSKWLEYIDPSPVEIIFWFESAEYVVNPWYTLEETAIIPDPSPQTAFPVNYYEGHELDFAISEATANKLMPPGFTAKMLKPTELGSTEDYYASWYLANISQGEVAQRVNRADAFTFAEDKDGEPSLVFISAIIETPLIFLTNPILLFIFKYEVERLSRDPSTGEVAYPHYYVASFDIDGDGFSIIDIDLDMPQTPKSVTAFNTASCAAQGDEFSDNFVLANSQTYKTDTDRFLNYFNKDFIAADVESFIPTCILETPGNVLDFN